MTGIPGDHCRTRHDCGCGETGGRHDGPTRTFPGAAALTAGLCGSRTAKRFRGNALRAISQAAFRGNAAVQPR